MLVSLGLLEAAKGKHTTWKDMGSFMFDCGSFGNSNLSWGARDWIQETSRNSSPLCVCVVLCCLLAFHLQPMEIYVDDEAKLTLHGLVQVLMGLTLVWATSINFFLVAMFDWFFSYILILFSLYVLILLFCVRKVWLALTEYLCLITALHQVGRGGEESQTQRLAGRLGFQPGGDLCQECQPCCGVEQATGGMQLSFYLYPLWHVSGGTVCLCLLLGYLFHAYWYARFLVHCVED